MLYPEADSSHIFLICCPIFTGCILAHSYSPSSTAISAVLPCSGFVPHKPTSKKMLYTFLPCSLPRQTKTTHWQQPPLLAGSLMTLNILQQQEILQHLLLCPLLSLWLLQQYTEWRALSFFPRHTNTNYTIIIRRTLVCSTKWFASWRKQVSLLFSSSKNELKA